MHVMVTVWGRGAFLREDDLYREGKVQAGASSQSDIRPLWKLAELVSVAAGTRGVEVGFRTACSG